MLQPVNEIQSNFQQNGQRLVWRFKEQILWVEPWGKDSIRVRATTLAEMPLRDWSLLPQKKSSGAGFQPARFAQARCLRYFEEWKTHRDH